MTLKHIFLIITIQFLIDFSLEIGDLFLLYLIQETLNICVGSRMLDGNETKDIQQKYL